MLGNEDGDSIAEETDKPVVQTEAQPEPQGDSESSEEQSGEETTDESKAKHKGGFQKRIDQLTRNNRELATRLEQAIGKLETVVRPEPLPEAPSSKPNLDSFSTYEDYIAALSKWEVKRERQAEKTADAVRAQQADIATKAQRFEELCDEVRKEVPDFDDIAFDQSLKLTNMMVESIQESDIGPRILLHLQKNRAEAKRIAGLSHIAQIKEIGRIEEKLQSRAAATSKAPDPISPLRSNNNPMTGLRDDLPIDQWMKVREKQSKFK